MGLKMEDKIFMDMLFRIYEDRKLGIRNLGLMTCAQKESRDRIIKQYGRIPIFESYDHICNSYMIEYDFITIGIELDGYAHS